MFAESLARQPAAHMLASARDGSHARIKALDFSVVYCFIYVEDVLAGAYMICEEKRTLKHDECQGWMNYSLRFILLVVALIDFSAKSGQLEEYVNIHKYRNKIMCIYTSKSGHSISFSFWANFHGFPKKLEGTLLHPASTYCEKDEPEGWMLCVFDYKQTQVQR